MKQFSRGQYTGANFPGRNFQEVGCGEGVVYLASPWHLTDIGLLLGKACYPPCSRQW